MDDESATAILRTAWSDYGSDDPIASWVETSAGVSTNRVYHVRLASGRRMFAKVSSYGSYVHFRQDHARIHQWCQLLIGTPYERFLARVLLKDGEVYTFYEHGTWVVFYEEAPRRGLLPRALNDAQIENLGHEAALFHRACADVASRLDPTWQSLGSDLAMLFDQMHSRVTAASRGFASEHARLVRRHCDLFFTNAERLGYHRFQKLPVLIDWNRGNFSVAYDEYGFQLYSRWDYDWFRIEPRTMDFYFYARVVREDGDQTVFSYTASPLLEPRFLRFVRAYHSVFPLAVDELAFAKEAYRFFLLNYVLRTGEHFFVGDIIERLEREALTRYLPELERLDFAPLLECVE
jgi:Ser/Thr protein kinase RdoA (MazF antagonist)